MADIVFVIPSVLNRGAGEKRIDMTVDSLPDAFGKAADIMGDDFRRRVLEPDQTPRSLINVYINGKNAQFSGGMNAALSDGDEVYVLPAVAGGAQDLTSQEQNRYSRQVMLEEIGYNGQIKLKGASACVVGTGGLGNPVAVRLVAMGVGTIRIIDRDVIEMSNLPRQIMFYEEDIGKVKVEAAAEKLRRLNGSCKVQAIGGSVNEYSAPDVVSGCDVVVDALDSVNARYALNKACVKANIPFVTGGAVGVSGQVFTVLPGKSACYHCMFPLLEEDSMPKCSIEGVHPAILSIIGGMEVSEAVKVILGQKPGFSEQMLHIDIGESVAFTKTRMFRAPECPVCGSGKAKAAASVDIITEELCGRSGGKRTFSLTPTDTFDVDMNKMRRIASQMGLTMENQGEMGVSLRNKDMYINILRRGSAMIVGADDTEGALSIYRKITGHR